MFNKFSEIPDFIHAGFPGLCILSNEPEQPQASLIKLLSKDEDITFSFATWDCCQGLQEIGSSFKGADNKSIQPTYPLLAEHAARQSGEDRRIIFLHNFHRFLENPIVSQALYNALLRGESLGTHYILLQPSSRLPQELERCITLFDFPLPTPSEISSICSQLDPSLPISPRTIEAAKGLTRRELRNTLSLSIRQHSCYDPDLILFMKSQEVSKSGVLTLLQPSDSFSTLAGLQGAKDLIVRLTSPNPLSINAKGILVVGVSGGGKSALARAASSAVGRPLLRLDMGALMHKHVGQSEENLRDALKIADATSPNILMIDEIEKGFSGASSEGGDSGTTRRMFGTMLTWLEERTTPVFIIATSNDVSSLPSEFLRAGRWTCELFVDLPTPKEREDIFSIYLKKYLIPDLPAFDHTDWTGGEIKQCCELACLLQIPLAEAAKKVRITARTRPHHITDLRKYASDSGLLCASTGQPYQLPSSSSPSHQQPTLPRKIYKTQKPPTHLGNPETNN